MNQIATQSEPAKPRSRPARCYDPELVAQLKELLKTLDYSIKTECNIAAGSMTHKKLQSIRAALGHNGLHERPGATNQKDTNAN